MIKLQYFNGKKWVDCGDFHNEVMAWVSLGGDDYNYRTVDTGSHQILTDKSSSETPSNLWEY